MSEQQQEQKGLKINGLWYDLPDDFTIGEAEMVKEKCGLTPQGVAEQWLVDASDPQMLRAVVSVILTRAKVKFTEDQISEMEIGAMFPDLPPVEGDEEVPTGERSGEPESTLSAAGTSSE